MVWSAHVAMIVLYWWKCSRWTTLIYNSPDTTIEGLLTCRVEISRCSAEDGRSLFIQIPPLSSRFWRPRLWNISSIQSASLFASVSQVIPWTPFCFLPWMAFVFTDRAFCFIYLIFLFRQELGFLIAIWYARPMHQLVQWSERWKILGVLFSMLCLFSEEM